MTTDRAVTRQQLADALGCKPSYVSKLRAAGRVVMAEDGKHYLLAATYRRMQETRDPAHQAVADRHAAARGAALAPAGGAGQGEDTARQPGAPSSPAQAVDDAVAGISPTYADARARREHAEATLRELDLRKRQGEILERADVEAAADRALTAASARLDALQDIIGPQIVGLDDEARARALVAEAVLIVKRELVRDFAAFAQVPA